MDSQACFPSVAGYRPCDDPTAILRGSGKGRKIIGEQVGIPDAPFPFPGLPPLATRGTLPAPLARDTGARPMVPDGRSGRDYDAPASVAAELVERYHVRA